MYWDRDRDVIMGKGCDHRDSLRDRNVITGKECDHRDRDRDVITGKGWTGTGT